MLPLNQNLQRLFHIAQKPVKVGIGLMSGTSLDGLDIALCSFTGSGFNTRFELLQFVTIPYPQSFKYAVQQVFAKTTVDLQQLTLLNAFIGNYHGELVLKALFDWKVEVTTVDYIASHGQTIYHAPKRLHLQQGYNNATLQIGDGDHLAVKAGIFTISDFRQKHIAAGGEGAPLALYGDVLLGSKYGENRVLLNIGGIANLTYLPADSSNVLCTDIGPGNTLIDAACRKYFNKDYDEDAHIANSGMVNTKLLNALLNHSFFGEKAPKTTGPELFNLAYVEAAQKLSATENMSSEDLISTLTEFTTAAIIKFINENIAGNDLKLFVSGGGAKNPYLIARLKKEFKNIDDTGSLGIDPDAKEAILFALLGNEALCGEPLTIGSNPAVLMGKFSFPV